MERFNVSHSRTECIKAFDGSCLMILCTAVLLLICLMSATVEAAEISFDPGQVSINLVAGDEAVVPVNISLVDLDPDSFVVAFFTLARVDGDFPTLEKTATDQNIRLDSLSPSKQVFLNLKAPEDLAGGTYTAIYETRNLRSNTALSKVVLKIDIMVEELNACHDVPVFTELSTGQDVIETRNNKIVNIDFTGNVAQPEGCSLIDVSYRLDDEYGEFEDDGSIEIDKNGDFEVSVKMLASRDGTDKDGRVYTLTFLASNEIGEGPGETVNITVAHDNGVRKKNLPELKEKKSKTSK